MWIRDWDPSPGRNGTDSGHLCPDRDGSSRACRYDLEWGVLPLTVVASTSFLVPHGPSDLRFIPGNQDTTLTLVPGPPSLQDPVSNRSVCVRTSPSSNTVVKDPLRMPVGGRAEDRTGASFVR